MQYVIVQYAITFAMDHGSGPFETYSRWPTMLLFPFSERPIFFYRRVRRWEYQSELLPRHFQNKGSLATREPVLSTNFPPRLVIINALCEWRRTQVVRERSAKPLCIGSNPIGAS